MGWADANELATTTMANDELDIYWWLEEGRLSGSDQPFSSNSQQGMEESTGTKYKEGNKSGKK